MKDLELVNILSYGGPIAVLEKSEKHFVGAFCSGGHGQNLTVKIFKKKEINPSTYWPRDSPVSIRLLDKINKINPDTNKKLSMIMNKHWMLTIKTDINPNTVRQI